MEQWLPIPGYDGFYEASNLGRIRGLPRPVKVCGGSYRVTEGGIIKPSSAGNGYVSFALCRNGKKRRMTVHRAVCEAFHGPHKKGLWARHLNGNRSDNRADNLAWGTPKQNCADTILHGRTSKGVRAWNTRLTNDCVLSIREKRERGQTYREIAELYPIGVGGIQAICTRRSWKHI